MLRNGWAPGDREAAPVLERPVPYNLQAEEAVLGALILDRDAITRLADWLAPGDFYRDAHGGVYAAICALYRRQEPPDVVTLADELARRGQLEACGGPAALARWMQGCASAVHVEYYARIVRRTAVLRRLISIGGQIAGLGYEDASEPDALLAQARGLLADVDRGTPDAWVSLRDVWAQVTDTISSTQVTGGVRPIPTGFPTLDARLGGGWRPQELVILAALTSRGKSALALHFARAAALAGQRVAVVSLEASKEALALRLLAREAMLDYGMLRAATLGEHDWRRVASALADGDAAAGRIWFSDAPAVTLAALETQLDRLRAAPDKGCDLLIVDYLQLLEAARPTENRARDVAGISRGLKLLAMRARIPVIALSQLNREAVGADQPGLHHLRESGSIEQDANTVLFLHRPQKTDPTVVHLLLAKQREGEADLAIPLRWHGSIQRFTELAV